MGFLRLKGGFSEITHGNSLTLCPACKCPINVGHPVTPFSATNELPSLAATSTASPNPRLPAFPDHSFTPPRPRACHLFCKHSDTSSVPTLAPEALPPPIQPQHALSPSQALRPNPFKREAGWGGGPILAPYRKGEANVTSPRPQTPNWCLTFVTPGPPPAPLRPCPSWFQRWTRPQRQRRDSTRWSGNQHGGLPNRGRATVQSPVCLRARGGGST